MPNWPCPVCGTPHVTDYMDTIEGTLCELKEHCPNGCMECEFAYGASRERIGDQVWEWSYSERIDEWRKRWKERDEAIQNLKEKRDHDKVPPP